MSSPYPGINAHLNSFLLQPDGGWEMFHAAHIIQLQQVLDEVLPPNYYAAPEKSLQVVTQRMDNITPSRTIPDIGVYQTHRGDPANIAGRFTTPTVILPLVDVILDDEPEINAVNIYQFEAGQIPGRLVTRIELLSPANKPGGSHYRRYLQRRHETLHSHVNLIEIDYLPHTLPILPEIPVYSKREKNAAPYYVLVSRPYPSVEEGTMPLYAVQVDQPLPRLIIPLAGADEIIFDLQDVYHRTVGSGRVFRLLADYSKPLVNPDYYTPLDQQRISELIAAFE